MNIEQNRERRRRRQRRPEERNRQQPDHHYDRTSPRRFTRPTFNGMIRREPLEPKQTEKSENARKREGQVDRVWLAVFDRDCHFSTPTKMLGSNVNFYREANIVLNHTDQISYDVYAQYILT